MGMLHLNLSDKIVTSLSLEYELTPIRIVTLCATVAWDYKSFDSGRPVEH